eukprot:CAMPEP_0117603156 /NCGR_PEP_ID=MMETSP0784-20121206/77978_1 /TAXON_ID=39447 /ORGANISM="" /LENGTH=38 /DNA_ID= /DNA_START= /DNA_END= /DNA_ORIENTATION=
MAEDSVVTGELARTKLQRQVVVRFVCQGHSDESGAGHI